MPLHWRLSSTWLLEGTQTFTSWQLGTHDASSFECREHRGLMANPAVFAWSQWVTEGAGCGWATTKGGVCPWRDVWVLRLPAGGEEYKLDIQLDFRRGNRQERQIWERLRPHQGSVGEMQPQGQRVLWGQCEGKWGIRSSQLSNNISRKEWLAGQTLLGSQSKPFWFSYLVDEGCFLKRLEKKPGEARLHWDGEEIEGDNESSG